MQHPDEGTIHAWLDGALTPAEAAEVETHAASCATCRDAVAEARGLIAASSRIVSALDAVPAGVIPVRPSVKRPWYASTQLRAAAAVVFVAGASMILFNRQGDEPLSELSQRAISASSAEATAPDTMVMLEQGAATEAQPTAQANSSQKAATGSRDRTENRTADGNLRMAAPSRDQAAHTGSTVAENTVADAAPPSVSAAPPVTASAPAVAPAPAPPVEAERLVAGKSITVSPVVVTGSVSGVQEIADDLRVLGVDSLSGARVTRYRIATGAELVLTETVISGRGAVARERRFDAARAPAAPPPAPAAAAAMPPATVGQAIRAEAAALPPLETLTWTDAQAGKAYSLSGRVSKETLEQVRVRLQSPKR